jgi:hypothetical protein
MIVKVLHDVIYAADKGIISFTFSDPFNYLSNLILNTFFFFILRVIFFTLMRFLLAANF